LEYGLKTCLSASPYSRKPKKGVQNAPELESGIGTQTGTFGVPIGTFKVSNGTH